MDCLRSLCAVKTILIVYRENHRCPGWFQVLLCICALGAGFVVYRNPNLSTNSNNGGASVPARVHAISFIRSIPPTNDATRQAQHKKEHVHHELNASNTSVNFNLDVVEQQNTQPINEELQNEEMTPRIMKNNITGKANHSQVAKKILGKYHSRFKEGTLNLNDNKEKTQKVVKRNNHFSNLRYHSSFKIIEDPEGNNEDLKHFSNSKNPLLFDALINNADGKVLNKNHNFGERLRQYSKLDKSTKRPYMSTGFIIDHSNNNKQNQKPVVNYSNQESVNDRERNSQKLPHSSDTSADAGYIINEPQEEKFYPGQISFASELPPNTHEESKMYEHEEISNQEYTINNAKNENIQATDAFSLGFENVSENDKNRHQGGAAHSDYITNSDENRSASQVANLQEIISNIQGVTQDNTRDSIHTGFVTNHSPNEHGVQFLDTKDIMSNWNPDIETTGQYSLSDNSKQNYPQDFPINYYGESNPQNLKTTEGSPHVEYVLEQFTEEKKKQPFSGNENIGTHSRKAASSKSKARKQGGGKQNSNRNKKENNDNTENQETFVYDGKIFSVNEPNHHNQHTENLQIRDNVAFNHKDANFENVNSQNTSQHEYSNHRYKSNSEKSNARSNLNLRDQNLGNLNNFYPSRNNSRHPKPKPQFEVEEFIVLHDKPIENQYGNMFQDFHVEHNNNENEHFRLFEDNKNFNVKDVAQEPKNVIHTNQNILQEPINIAYKNQNTLQQPRNVLANNTNSFRHRNRNNKNKANNRKNTHKHNTRKLNQEIKSNEQNSHITDVNQNIDEQIQFVLRQQENAQKELENNNFNLQEIRNHNGNHHSGNVEQNIHLSQFVDTNGEYHNPPNKEENYNLNPPSYNSNETTHHLVDEVHNIHIPHHIQQTDGQQHEIETSHFYNDNVKYYPAFEGGQQEDKINDNAPHITFQSELNNGDIPQTHESPISAKEIQNIHQNVKEHYNINFKEHNEQEINAHLHQINVEVPQNTSNSKQNKNRKANSELGNKYLRFRNNFKKSLFERQKKINTESVNDFHANTAQKESNEFPQEKPETFELNISNANIHNNPASLTKNSKYFPKFIKGLKNQGKNTHLSIQPHIVSGKYHKVEDDANTSGEHTLDENTHKLSEGNDPTNIRDIKPEVVYIDSSQLPPDVNDDGVGVKITDNGAFYTQDSQGNLHLNRNVNGFANSNAEELKSEYFPNEKPQEINNNNNFNNNAAHHLEDLTGNRDVTITLNDKPVPEITVHQPSSLKERKRANSTISSTIRNSIWNRLRGRKTKNNSFKNNDKNRDTENKGYKPIKSSKPIITRQQFIIRKKPDKKIIPIAPVTVKLPEPPLKVSYSLTPEAKLKTFLDTHKIPKTDFPFFDQYFHDIHSMKELAEVMKNGYTEGQEDMFYEIPEVDGNVKPLFSKYSFPQVPKVEPVEPIRTPDFSSFDFHTQMPKMQDEYSTTFEDFINKHYKPFENRKISFEITDFDNIPQFSNDQHFQHEEIANVTFHTLQNMKQINKTLFNLNQDKEEVNISGHQIDETIDSDLFEEPKVVNRPVGNKKNRLWLQKYIDKLNADAQNSETRRVDRTEILAKNNTVLSIS